MPETTTEAFNTRKDKLIRQYVDEHIKKVEAVEKHTAADCLRGNHLLDVFVTGGRDGHCIEKCLLCDYRHEDWDT